MPEMRLVEDAQFVANGLRQGREIPRPRLRVFAGKGEHADFLAQRAAKVHGRAAHDPSLRTARSPGDHGDTEGPAQLTTPPPKWEPIVGGRASTPRRRPWSSSSSSGAPGRRSPRL